MKVRLADRVQSVKEYYFSTKLRQIAQMRANGLDILNLGIGSPNLPPSIEVIELLKESASDATNHAYQSYKGIPELRNAWSTFYEKHYGVKVESDSEVLPLIGSKEGIMHISMTYLQPGDQVLVPNPGYPTYASASRLAGAEVIYYDLNERQNWYPDLSAIQSLNLEQVRIMWLNYPNMPSGAAGNVDLFRDLVEFGRRNDILLCHDNPYSFIQTEKPKSILEIEGAKDVALELNSLSKTFNMAGWRVGACIANADRITEIMRFKSNMDSGMFKPLQQAAAKALDLDVSWIEQNNFVYTQRKKKAFDLLDVLGCRYTTNQTGMFVWARTPGDVDDKIFIDRVLNQANVFLTPGSIFGSNGQRYVRLSLCSDISDFEEAIKRCSNVKLEIPV